jgi:VanZ family protein
MSVKSVASLWLPVLLVMAIIFIGSSQQYLPVPESHALDVFIKKTGHALEYALLGLLLLRAWQGCVASWSGVETPGEDTRPASAWPGAVALAILVGGLYAASDELHQRFVPSRNGNLRDVLIDLGALTVTVLLAWLWQRAHSRLPVQDR